MKLFKIIESTILCIRFPFLYPRNRFTGLHYTNWKMYNFIKTWSSKTYDCLWFKPYYDKNGYNSILLDPIDNIRNYYVEVKDGYVSISMDHKVYWKKPFSYFGEGEIKGVVRGYNGNIGLIIGDDFKKNNENSWLIPVCHSKWLHNLCKIVNWIHEHPVQWLHAIPTYTELDAMETGWRNAFGIKMCKEIKKALKEKHCLKSYRIVQIKEKFGSLRWYDNGSTEEVLNIINKYENISYHTCIICGKPATYLSKGWISPYCTDCVNDREQCGPINDIDYEKILE